MGSRSAKLRMGADERREQILSCAMVAFEETPYNDVSMGDIAARAGIARPLIHHYFGTKRELYLEVVRRLTFVPASAVKVIAHGSLAERADATIDRWLRAARRHRNLWSAMFTFEGPARDLEIEKILYEADQIAADRMLEALGLDGAGPGLPQLRAMMLAHGGMMKAATRQWLVNDTLTREQVHVLLVRTLISVVHEVAPSLKLLEPTR